MKYLLLISLFLGSTFPPKAHHSRLDNVRPKNIILLIGDGMGLSQISAGFYANGKILNLEKFPVTGIMSTHASSHLITDSAAAATAFSCGCKTYNGAIGVTNKRKPCQTILEHAKANGLAAGLIASCSITHATPAAFIAHVKNRAEHETIATYFLKTPIDLMIGGGMKYFNNRKLDDRNLCTELVKKGFLVADFESQKLTDLPFLPTQPIAWFAAKEEPVSVGNGRNWLPFAAQKAPQFLKQRSEKGFFMMLEGAQIDWACHANEGARAVQEMLDFDAAIGKILAFAEADGETLVIVTADHETGGMALEQSRNLDSLELAFNTTAHTATFVPVFAYGPGAERFSGFIDNTDIYKHIMELFGFQTLNPNEKKP